MAPTLSNVDAEAYSAIFKEAGKLLQLQTIQGYDLHELSHRVTERFFLRDGNEPLPECVGKVMAEENEKIQAEASVEEKSSLDDILSIEATLDIYKIYLKVSNQFSAEEKIIFFSMLDENPLTGISGRLNISQAKINELKKSILEKIKHAFPGAKNS